MVLRKLKCQNVLQMICFHIGFIDVWHGFHCCYESNKCRFSWSFMFSGTEKSLTPLDDLHPNTVHFLPIFIVYPENASVYTTFTYQNYLSTFRTYNIIHLIPLFWLNCLQTCKRKDLNMIDRDINAGNQNYLFPFTKSSRGEICT